MRIKEFSMKRFISLIVLGNLCFFSLVHSCEYVHEEWHTQSPADVQNHHSPVPEHNTVAPDQVGSATREVIDTFSQEDHSNVEGDGENQVKTDQPLEEHLEEMVECQDRSEAEDAGQSKPLPCNKAQHYNTRGNFQSGQSLSREDVFGDASNKGENHYSIKNTAGMIYKTDQTTCDTAFEHPTTGYSSGESGKEQNHDFVFDANGNMTTNSDNKYCFYLLIPGNGDSEGKLARVDAADENSKIQIKNGNAPYIPLSDTDLAKLKSGTGDLHFVKGRYITPMPEGKMLLPTNSPQMLFNRTTVYRPYFQDIKRKTEGSISSQALLNDLDNTFDPVDESGTEKSTFFAIDGISSQMSGLDHKTSLITKASDERVGNKLSGWHTELVGPQYLAVGPSGDPAKRLNVALHFPNHDSEKEYIESVTNGTFDPNKNRDAISNDRKLVLLNESDRQALLSEAVKFQMKVSGKYITDNNDVPFDPNLLKDENPVVDCAQAESHVQAYCDKYMPLRENLKTLYAQLGITNVAGADEVFKSQLTERPFDKSKTVGVVNFQITAAREKIGSFQNENAKLLNDLNYNIEGSDANKMDDGFSKYIRKTNEGKDQASRLYKLQASWMHDSEKLSEINLVNKNEYKFFNDNTEGFDEAQLVNLATTRYMPLETDNVTRNAFLNYTSHTDEGKKLLTKLGLIQRTTGKPDPSKVAWQSMAPQEPACPVGGGITNECLAIINSDNLQLSTQEMFDNRFDPSASPHTIEIMP